MPSDPPRESAPPESGYPAARRPSRAPGRPSEDTLLSAPLPADGAEAIFDERLTRVEMRQIDIDTRLTALEASPDRARGGWREWVPWVALAALLLLAYKVLFS